MLCRVCAFRKYSMVVFLVKNKDESFHSVIIDINLQNTCPHMKTILTIASDHNKE